MYKEILVPIDLNEESSWRKALPTAAAYCRAFGARLNVLTVVPDLGLPVVAAHFPHDYEEKAIAEAESRLRDLLAAQLPKGVEARPIVAHGTIYDEIIKTAEAIGADLIVMAAHRPALSDYLIGPNAARVVRHANRSVLVVRD